MMMMMKFIFNAFVDLKPVERFENGSDEDLGALTARASRVLDLLEPVKLIVWKVVIERVTVIKFRMDNGGGNGCFEVEIWADTAKFANVIVAGFKKCRDLVGEGINKVFIKDKAKVTSRVGFRVRKESCILESCCLSPIRRVESDGLQSARKRSVVEHFASESY